MSVSKNDKTKKAGEPKTPRKLSASQLFDRYMKGVERIRVLAMRLDKELADSQNLSAELAARFGVYVSGKEPTANVGGSTAAPTPAPTPAPATVPAQPTQDADVAAAEQEPTPEGKYQPPAQGHTAEAVRLTGAESAAVAKIRADSTLSPEQQADAEALAISGGPGKLAKLQAAMGGIPAVVPSPGAVEERRGSPDSGPDNKEGGPVTQEPTKE